MGWSVGVGVSQGKGKDGKGSRKGREERRGMGLGRKVSVSEGSGVRKWDDAKIINIEGEGGGVRKERYGGGFYISHV